MKSHLISPLSFCPDNYLKFESIEKAMKFCSQCKKIKYISSLLQLAYSINDHLFHFHNSANFKFQLRRFHENLDECLWCAWVIPNASWTLRMSVQILTPRGCKSYASHPSTKSIQVLASWKELTFSWLHYKRILLRSGSSYCLFKERF